MDDSISCDIRYDLHREESTMEFVKAEQRGDVAWLCIDRADRRNALSAQVVMQLRMRLGEARQRSQTRVVVVTGVDDSDFSAGGDLTEMNEAASPLEAHQLRSELNLVFRDLQELGKPTIARVCGLALAGGFGLALGCDFIIAAQDAQFGLPEVHFGLWPYIVTESLTRAVPPRVALQLMLTGRRIDAEEGHRLGFVTTIAPRDGLDVAVDALVAMLRRASPEATSLGRTSFYRAIDAMSPPRTALLEATMSVNLGLTDAHEGLTAFAEKRRPRWAVAGYEPNTTSNERTD
jgi:enoyl-CoA hydratase